MIEAIEHDFDMVEFSELKAVLAERINWTLNAVTEVNGDYTLFWSRTCPAVPNLGETK